MIGLIGKKLGMSRQFDEDGRSVPVTLIEAGPCVVTQVKTIDHDGYDAVQLGYGRRKPKNTPLPMQGHFPFTGTRIRKRKGCHPFGAKGISMSSGMTWRKTMHPWKRPPTPAVSASRSGKACWPKF